MMGTLTVSFDCEGLESILKELKARPQAAHTVMELIKAGRNRELFALSSDQESGHITMRMVPTDLMRFILSAHDC
jgi:hypothetical protein